MRLIDADALSEAMYRKSFETDDGRQRWDGGLWIRYKVFEEARGEAPTIDAEPVRHGKWKPYRVRLTRSVKGGMYEKGLRCSQCNYKDGDCEYAYCPNCGAKMEEDDETY